MKRAIISLTAFLGIFGGVAMQAPFASPAHAGYWEYRVATTGEIGTTDADLDLIDAGTDNTAEATETTTTTGWFRYATSNP